MSVRRILAFYGGEAGAMNLWAMCPFCKTKWWRLITGVKVLGKFAHVISQKGTLFVRFNVWQFSFDKLPNRPSKVGSECTLGLKEGQDYCNAWNVITVNIVDFDFQLGGSIRACFRMREDSDPPAMLTALVLPK